jgi:uncharacterized membrane protein YesL
MFLFTVKKSFFDMWDNFLMVAIFNLGFIVLLMIPIWLPSTVAEASIAAAFLIQAIGILIVFIYAGVVAMAAKDMANYQRPEFRRLVAYLKETWVSSLVLGLIYVAITVFFRVGLDFYSQLGNLLGLAAIVFLMWALILFALASQYYFPIRAQLDTKIKKILRKSFILLFDNTFFTVFLAVGTIATAGISIFTALLLPGLTGVLIWHQVALKLRLYKYDYLEENPDANRKEIPWDALLIDDREKVGKRTLRGMIFPWKE